MTVTDAAGIGTRTPLHRMMAIASVAVLLIVFIAGVVVLVAHLGERPALPVSGWTDEQLRAAAAAVGVPVEWVARYLLLLEVLLAALGATAGWVLLRGGRSTAFRSYLAVVLVLNCTLGGAVPSALATLYPELTGPAGLVQATAWCALMPAAYAFPDGRFVPRWTRTLAPAWLVLLVALLVLPPALADGPVTAAVALVLFASCAVAQVHRYRWVSGPVERAQQRWVALAVALRVAYLVVSVVTPLGAAMHRPDETGLVANVIALPISYAISGALAAAVTVAVVRHRLYDVDAWILRTVVYAVLTAFVVGTYVAVVGGIGALSGNFGDVVAPLVATVVVALLVEQVRSRAQGAARRAVYGTRGEPYRAVADLSRRLGGTLPPDEVAAAITSTLHDGLKVAFVELVVDDQIVATRGVRGAGPEDQFVIRYDDTDLGELRIVGERLSGPDRALIADLARQAGVALHADAITAALRRSREALATSREEERRRLHRDLHDGLSPTLAGLHQRIDAAHRLVGADPDRARALLADSRAQLLTTIGEVRELVDALRPALLDELGLVGAIELTIERLAPQPGPPAMEMRADQLPALPAAVEIALYRVAVEAVTNVVRHAAADRCRVTLSAGSEMITLNVADDGRGLGGSSRPRSGLRTVRERVEEIGGAITVESRGGTTVTAHVPLRPRPEARA